MFLKNELKLTEIVCRSQVNIFLNKNSLVHLIYFFLNEKTLIEILFEVSSESSSAKFHDLQMKFPRIFFHFRGIVTRNFIS